jgi:hypothetical protein
MVNADLDKPAHVRRRISVCSGALLSALSLTLFFIAAQATFGVQPASAGSHYGILGSQAPALDLDTWIDGRGEKMAPIHLGAYCGKVIYNDFHIAVDQAIALIQKLIAMRQP